MAGRSERCSWCGIQLAVPPEASAIRCAVCFGTTQVRPNDPFIQAQNSFSHVTSRFRDFMNTFMEASVNSNPRMGASEYGYYTQPPRPRSSLMPPSVHGKKRAVLCGIRYHGQSYRLKGSVNDVKSMRFFLINKMGFPSDSIVMLTDNKEERNPLMIPTKYNIQTALRWLIQGCQSGDSLVFHYSGHGSRELDDNMDELDGYDEALCPVDYETNGKIIDDEINDTIVKPLPRGAKLHAIIDACHSGTVLDLPFVCKMNPNGNYSWQDQRYSPAINKGTSGGLAISISACADDQISVDTTALSGKTVTGALTYSLIQTAQNEPGLTYGRLLNAMRRRIREAKTGIVGFHGPISSLFNRMIGVEITQEPQLSSSEKFEIYSKQFAM
ncbi:Metacaspase-1 [Quillaja saponaria]|uniref:Metacaspase-1 n=1 Tax=Quillaja saponaria TaxID=32244 RepID=A0AAD7PUT8_QUISA|nr:Metacaspase-1 [Quillaja saponaria]